MTKRKKKKKAKETDPKRTQMLELAKIFKVVVISVLKDIKENTLMTIGKTVNLSRVIEARKKTQMEILELKTTISEI